jgi:phage replication-related protein YjqB (UPF0714/DUF867 family)
MERLGKGESNMGRYSNYAALARHEREGRDFEIHVRNGSSGIAVVAPHGGRIEPGTFEIADFIAGAEHSFYGFRGIKPTQNADLHIASIRFDEPRAVRIVESADLVLAIHGCRGKAAVVRVGGLDQSRMRRICCALSQTGLAVDAQPKRELGGIHPANLCNRGKSGRGIQLEISSGLREKMFVDLSIDIKSTRTVLFHRFVFVMRKAVDNFA